MGEHSWGIVGTHLELHKLHTHTAPRLAYIPLNSLIKEEIGLSKHVGQLHVKVFEIFTLSGEVCGASKSPMVWYV
jgi:hypothetical protein